MDDNDEMDLPVIQGKVDPTVLAVLPPSMQLDLLVQMREQLMADNRQKFQKVKKAPASFSQLQIQSYLKTVAFRREIEEIQKSAASRGIGGMPTSRIASESGREFIFSTSFTGDKQALGFPGSKTDDREEGSAAQEKATVVSSAPTSVLNSSIFTINSAVQPQNEASDGDSEPPVQTYVDENGQVRVSRVRGMGIRMTRDLQWNLYLMKESEEQAMQKGSSNMKEGTSDRARDREEMVAIPVEISETNEDEVEGLYAVEPRYERKSLSNACADGEKMSLQETDHFQLDSQGGGTRGLQISFREDEIGEPGKEDDDIFAALVAGQSIPEYTLDNVYRGTDTQNHVEDDALECEWEVGQVKANRDSEVAQSHSGSTRFHKVSEEFSVEGSGISVDSEVEWEDGNNVIVSETGLPSKGEKIVSRGTLSEEAELQEAIRRSLEDFGVQRPRGSSSQLVINEIPQGNFEEGSGIAMPVKVYPHMNELVEASDKEHEEDFSERERSRKGKALLNEEVDNASGKDNLKLQGYNEQGCQGVAVTESSKIDQKHTTMEKISSENVNVTRVLTSSYKKGIEDEHLSSVNDMQGSSVNDMQGPNMVQEVLTPMESNTLCAMQSNVQQLQHTGIRELQNENTESTLQCSESRRIAGDADADNRTRMQKFESGGTDEPGSGNDVTVCITASQDELLNRHLEDSSDYKLIREAEEADISKDREELSKKEAELVAMKKEHLKKKEEFEAELEAEKEALQAGIDEEMAFLRQEELDLRTAQKKHERNAESVSGEMFAECQELLQMFGLPYLIAPMEAEAQCAFMELAHLVDGVVTDDCDVFLFGAGSVYKNIFDDRKYVETYFMKDIEKELGLNREKLIRMAMLLGSDYTEGISGIGIVNAIEVVNAFPEEDGLKKFKEWLDSPDPSLLEKVHARSGKSSRKRSSKQNKKAEHRAEEKQEDDTVLDQNNQRGQEDELSEERNLALKQVFMEKHRAVSKNWHVPDSFPNESVVSAYTVPQVDKSTETFLWGRPDLMALRKLCWERFGWTKVKADELLLPVLKEYDRHETQLRLEAFYSFNERFAKIRSRRIQKAVTGITGQRSSEVMDLSPHLMSTPQKKSRKNKENGGVSGPILDGGSNTLVDVENEILKSEVQGVPGKEDKKQGRQLGVGLNVVEPEHRTLKTPTRGRGKGRGRGRGGKASAGKGHGKRAQLSSSADDSGSEQENEASQQGQLKRKVSAESVELRKSTRPRREVKYTPDEQGSDSAGYVSNDSDSEMTFEVPEVQVLQKQTLNSSDRECGGFEMHDDLHHIESQHPGDVDSRDESLCTDYLATGGGFCFEEENHKNGIDTINDSLVGNVIPDGDGMKCSTSQCVLMDQSNQVVSADKYVDYLSGGRFCVSEDADCLSTGEDLSKYQAQESQFEKDVVGNLKGRTPPLADVTSEMKAGTSNSGSVVGLRAMPFLRRKKRTSS
eukprot:Gb_23486 [translate_table: standard]